MAGHAQLKFVMTECSKTQIRLTGPINDVLLIKKIKSKIGMVKKASILKLGSPSKNSGYRSTLNT